MNAHSPKIRKNSGNCKDSIRDEAHSYWITTVKEKYARTNIHIYIHIYITETKGFLCLKGMAPFHLQKVRKKYLHKKYKDFQYSLINSVKDKERYSRECLRKNSKKLRFCRK